MVERPLNGWTDGWMINRWEEKRVSEWMGGWMDAWMDRWMDGWVDG